MRSKHYITLLPQIFNVIKLFHEARNNIIHESKDAKSDFAILELCSTTINEYFTFILGKFYNVNKYNCLCEQVPISG